MKTEIYQDPTKPLQERVADLIGKMSLEEKAGELIYTAAGVKRLGIPGYNWWNEALHGVARNGKATIFPQSIGLAATFDTELVQQVADTIADEARAKFNYAVKTIGESRQYQGLTFWTPNINIFRDPRWGRGQETYGEDTYLTSRMGAAFVKGLQGNHPRYMKTAACAKHYAVHSGPEALRHEFDAVVSPKDLWETYLPAFKALVDAGVEAVMGAYNRTLGEPCCASEFLMNTILRGKWKFEGHYVSDCWAIRDFHQSHNVTGDAVESVALAMEKGCDLNCGDSYAFLMEALLKGKVKEEWVDRSLTRLLSTKMKLGLFDPPEMVPFSQLGPDVIGCAEHVELSRRAAEKSIVLLKNKDGLLPLNPEKGYYYVTGPNAADIAPLLGNYYGLNPRMVTPLEGMMDRAGLGVKIDYRKGCLLDHEAPNPIEWAIFESAAADATIAFMGLNPELEGEEGDAISSPSKGDRDVIELPENQLNFLRKIKARNAKLILVLMGGAAMAIKDMEDLADAVVLAWIPGQEGGTAIAKVLFGEVNPGGKLPVTFPASTAQLPPFADYSMENRTYKYMKDDPLYPFGFGLSYTSFAYSSMTLSASSIASGENLSASVTVTNTGDLGGEEVVQMYITDDEASARTPKASLCGFKRIFLAPGETGTLEFEVASSMMELVTDTGERVIEPGSFTLYAGGCSPGTRGKKLGASQGVSASFSVKG
ncbi:MAG: glycoside hydrolase family 3 C-terminal domain-containing protein [Spirochaetales bacterium]|nr:glycoside hydrolase family 3 C-terminal domain-containing protein [Spirochaetales bacterium]